MNLSTSVSYQPSYMQIQVPQEIQYLRLCPKYCRSRKHHPGLGMRIGTSCLINRELEICSLYQSMQKKFNRLDASARLSGADELCPDTVSSEGFLGFIAGFLFSTAMSVLHSEKLVKRSDANIKS